MRRLQADEPAAYRDEWAPLNALHDVSAEQAANDLTQLMATVAEMPLKVTATWRHTTAELDDDHAACPAIARAGHRLAQWIDRHALQADRPAYHNRQHVCEVMLVAAFLGRLHGLTAPERQLLLLAALVHDLDHPGQPQPRFVAERHAVLRSQPFLAGAQVPLAGQQRLAALVMATEPMEGVPHALACQAKRRQESRPPAPVAAPELQLLQVDPSLARLACLLCEADILPSVGLTSDYAIALHARLAAEWGRTLPIADKLQFVEGTLALGTVGSFFLPNVHRLRQVLLAGLDHHAMA